MMANALKAAGRPYELIDARRAKITGCRPARIAYPHADRNREVPGRKYLAGSRRTERAHRIRVLLQTRRAAPMYARLTFTGATGFDVGSEP